VHQPETFYAPVGNDRVAYQVLGEGPRDVLDVTGLWSHLDVPWEEPTVARQFRRIASFSRLIRFDPRGTGLSDPRPDDGRSIVEHWSEDLLAVLDSAGSAAPVFLCQLDAGPLALLFYRDHPDRCSGMMLVNTSARFQAAPDYPQGHSARKTRQLLDYVRNNWGSEEFCKSFVPSQASNEPLQRWFTKWCRAVASPREVADNLAAALQLDARDMLAQIEVPVLVLSRRDYAMFPVVQGRYLAEHIRDARFVELPGADALLQWDSADEALDLIEEFVTGQRRRGEPDRALATILFTDIVDSTKTAAKLGDAAWRTLLDRHDLAVREQIELFSGRRVDSAGDGTLAVFESPGRAIDCAHELMRHLREIGIDLRAGIHIGEIELREDGRVGGIAVHIGARVLGEARPREVLVSRTVRDVLIGSRYVFKDRGIHRLKGVPSKWPLYAVAARKTS
jgi:class 3 adenylate cyclase